MFRGTRLCDAGSEGGHVVGLYGGVEWPLGVRCVAVLVAEKVEELAAGA